MFRLFFCYFLTFAPAFAVFLRKVTFTDLRDHAKDRQSQFFPDVFISFDRIIKQFPQNDHTGCHGSSGKQTECQVSGLFGRNRSVVEFWIGYDFNGTGLEGRRDFLLMLAGYLDGELSRLVDATTCVKREEDRAMGVQLGRAALVGEGGGYTMQEYRELYTNAVATYGT